MASFEAADGARIYYELAGGEGGPWVTFINGHTRTSSDFKLWGRRLAAAGMRVLSFDNRGAGQTTTPPGFTLETIAADIAELWQHLGVASSHLVGISMGGVIASSLAAKAGAKLGRQVQSLVLVSTSGDAAALAKRTNSWPLTAEGMGEKLRSYFAADFLARNALLWRAMAKNMATQAANPLWMEGAKAQRQALAAQPPLDLALISCPTLILHGEEDAIIPVAAAHALHTAIAGSRLHLWPRAGHLLLAEKPAELAAAIEAFIHAQQGGSSGAGEAPSLEDS